MANTINVTDLTPIVAGAITTGQQVTIYDQSGNAGRAAIEDVVSAANTISGGLKVMVHTEIIPSADILTGNTTPVTLNIPRSSGESIGIVGTPVFSLSYGTATYATNTTAAIRYVGADIDMFTCDILGRTASGAKLGVPVTTVSASQSQVLENIDLEWYVKTGDPITGDGTTTVTVYYIKQV